MRQTAIAQLTKNMMIIDLMKETGWSRPRALAAVEELEAVGLVHFTPKGDLRLRMVSGGQ
ncbi:MULTISPECIES: hypothetical protein [Streptococcus]|uniref:Winged helix-turn-helix DNA-binding n=1 Tax=Streptococcus henryi TaxID=439219 RepID=A0A1G6BPA9_9STRE|nr:MULTISPECIES: hypothetical protein [Streptococcus]MBE3600774.1 hypothetical protein [Streptococcus agalactiae]SDB22472.1 hypothetical protein SAMN02910293_01137 [Streptococcus henryi]